MKDPMFDALSQERNKRIVECVKCRLSLEAGNAKKLMLDLRDPFDFDWVCDDCYWKLHFGEISL